MTSATQTARRVPSRPQRLWTPLPILGALVAVLAIILSKGALVSVVLWGLAILALIMAIGPPVPAMVMLIVVSSLDGILKGVATGWLTLLFKDIVLWLAVIRWLGMRQTGLYAKVPRVSTIYLMLVFVLWVCAEGVSIFSTSWVAALAGIRTWVGWMPAFFVAYEGIREHRDVTVLWLGIVVTAGLVGAYGVIQQSLGYEHLLAVSSGFSYVDRTQLGAGSYRAISTLSHPGIFGHFMATVLPVGLAFFLASLLPSRHRLLSGLAALGMAGGALASGGRLAMASLLTCGVLFVLLSRQARVVLVGIIVLAVVGAAAVHLVAPQAVRRVSSLFQLGATLQRVVHPLRQGWRAIREHPLGTGVATGVGIGRAARFLGGIEIQSEASGMIEGDYGRAFRELGLPGGLLFLYLVGHVLWRGLVLQRRVQHRGWRVVSAALFAVLFSEALGLTVGPSFYLMPVAGLFWLAYASLLRLAQLTPDLEGPGPEPAPPHAQGRPPSRDQAEPQSQTERPADRPAESAPQADASY